MAGRENIVYRFEVFRLVCDTTFIWLNNGPKAAMEDGAMDIVGQLMQQDLNYENLVKRFRGMALERREEVRCIFFPLTIA